MDEKCFYVYKHTNKVNGKVYIGITKQLPEKRWGENGNNYSSTPRFFNAIKKYGWDNFRHEILYSNLLKEEACEIEKRLIKELHTQDKNFGYNITEGGDTPTMPLEIREILSEKLKGNKNGLGKACSEEKRRKISETQRGRKLSEDHKRKLSLAKKGKTHTISEETKKKISDSHKKKSVFCEELQTVFPSIQECSRVTGVPATAICKICRGRGKSYNKLHFSYYTEVDI